jgi:hypothetical protein
MRFGSPRGGAKLVLGGVQWVGESPKHFKVAGEDFTVLDYAYAA